MRTRTPYTCRPAAIASATRRGASSRVAPPTMRVPSSVSSSTPRGRESSAGEPAATTWPARRIATRSQTSSISDSRCELSRTETPRSRSSSSRTRTTRRPAGSSAEVGSSRTSMRGEPTSACAIPRRCCIPFDMPSTRRSRASSSETRSSNRARSAAPPPERAEPLVEKEHLVGRVPAGEAEQLGEVAELGTGGARSCARAGDLGARRAWRARARPRSSRASTCLRRSGRGGPRARPLPPRGRRP